MKEEQRDVAWPPPWRCVTAFPVTPTKLIVSLSAAQQELVLLICFDIKKKKHHPPTVWRKIDSLNQALDVHNTGYRATNMSMKLHAASRIEFLSVTSSFCNFFIRTFKPHHVIYTAVVRTWAKFQLASIKKVKIEMFEVFHSPILTSYLASVPNFRNTH